MAKSLVQVRAEIVRLQRSFDAVIATMRKSIAFHGLTVEDLFGPSSAASNSAPSHSASARSQSSTGRAPKYGDASGNVWGGMGKRPAWLVTEMAAGKTKDSFLLSAAQLPVTAKAAAKPAVKRVLAAKVAPGKAKPGKSSAAAKKAGTAKVVPAKKTAHAKPVAGSAAAVSSKKPPTKKASLTGKPVAVAKKKSAGAKVSSSKTAAEVAPTLTP